MDPRQREAQQRPSYPQHTSGPSSAFSSLASLASVNNSAMPQSSQLSVPGSSAPLPSPSTQQPANYFGSLAPQATTSQRSDPQQQRMASLQQQACFVGQRHSGGAPETAPFLQDFNLVAEAAKRAQMACLSRDLDEVGL
ncbi:hypothetical protein Slin15195_G011730 [Septoria linicola]|uniref:Uncharacterized protein n=1 Tax=Septoria linicola TaxID=215465 RepID=A0A9Q9AE68_9PEZI|nr:hypothetical protein Slin14017_G011740 [Septoria linicola]USW47854.1 hypothetical protein Slin15195_G011730 [Septoria linicola]